MQAKIIGVPLPEAKRGRIGYQVEIGGISATAYEHKQNGKNSVSIERATGELNAEQTAAIHAAVRRWRDIHRAEHASLRKGLGW